jgi:YD repeat-containing protein
MGIAESGALRYFTKQSDGSYLASLGDNGVYQFSYVLNNNKVTQTDVTDPRGKVRRMTFNTSGYRLTDTRALGSPEAQTITYERQAGTNLPTKLTDALGRKTEADHALTEILASKSIADSAAYQVALIYAHRGDADHAFQWLERALKQRDAGMHWMKFDPLLQGLSADPRFKALLAQMHQS